MKGLILKDLLSLKKQGKLLLLMLVFFVVYSYATKNTSILGSMLAVLCTMLPITTLSCDERSKWDKFALSTPVQRKTVVVSKYVLSILFNITAFAIMTVINLILLPYTENANLEETVLTLLGTCMGTLLILAIFMPFLFKFGVEKSRFILMAIYALPLMISGLIHKMNIPLPDERFLKSLAYASPVITLCLLLISVNVSVGIYNKKEF